MIAAIFFFSLRGEVLLQRLYRDGVGADLAAVFGLQVLGAKKTRSPVNVLGGCTFVHVQHENLYVALATTHNMDVSVAFEVMYRSIRVLHHFFGREVNVASVRESSVVVHELLDEVLDYGYPQNTTSESLAPFLMTVASDKSADEMDNLHRTAKATAQVTGAVSWREPDLRFRKNELYIDVIENCNLLMSSQGTQLRADVSGQIMLKTQLSGMPECKFGLNDKVLMDKEKTVRTKPSRSSSIQIDDCTFHQCVRLSKFDTERTISFIPPDGEFELMRYRTTEHVNLPFRVLPNISEPTRTRIEYQVTVRSNYDPKLVGNNVTIMIPCPRNTASCKVKASVGRAKYRPEEDAIVWTIKRFTGRSEVTLSGHADLIKGIGDDKKGWSRPPITMKFTIPMLAASGLHIRYLKVVEPKQRYQTAKWVRYITKAGSYQVRF